LFCKKDQVKKFETDFNPLKRKPRLTKPFFKLKKFLKNFEEQNKNTKKNIEKPPKN
jgi:hypothetical protein